MEKCVVDFEEDFTEEDVGPFFQTSFPGLRDGIESKLDIELGDVEFVSLSEYKTRVISDNGEEMRGLSRRVPRVLKGPFFDFRLFLNGNWDDLAYCETDSLIIYRPEKICVEKPTMNEMWQMQAHELGHVAHLKIVGRKYFDRLKMPPQWLAEGFADKVALDVLSENGYMPGEGDYKDYDTFMSFFERKGVSSYSGIAGFLRADDRKS